MALSAATVMEIRDTGSDNNGAGWVTGASGTDYSQQASPAYTGTTGANVSPSTTFNDANANFGTDVVGNLLRIVSGDGTVGRYQITARNSATSLTLDRTQGGSGTDDIVYNIGGAARSLGSVNSSIVAGNVVHVRAGDYPLTAAVAITVSSVWLGYNTTRGDITGNPSDPTYPSLNAAANSFTMMTLAANNIVVHGFKFDGKRATYSSVRGLVRSSGAGIHLSALQFVDINSSTAGNTVVFNTSDGQAVFIYATNCTATNNAVLQLSNAYACLSMNNTGTGVNGFAPGTGVMQFCIAYGNTGAGFSEPDQGNTYLHCVSIGNGTGFVASPSLRTSVYLNCIAYGNTGWGISLGGTPKASIRNCAFGANGSGSVSATVSQTVLRSGDITLTAAPCIDAANGDFRLNDTAGGGAALKATSGSRVAYPDSFPGAALTVNHADIGAVQAAPAAPSTAGAILIGNGGGLIGVGE